jgi:CRP-like cAMP-binding protein
LENLLREDNELNLLLLLKVCHELREEKRHALLLGQRSAVQRLAMFLAALRQQRAAPRAVARSLYLAMSRRDIADYVGLTGEALSRAFAGLVRAGIVSFIDRRRLRIIKPHALASIAVHSSRAMRVRLSERAVAGE